MNFFNKNTKPQRYRIEEEPYSKKILKFIIIMVSLFLLTVLTLIIFEFSMDQYNKETNFETTSSTVSTKEIKPNISSYDFGSYNLACDWRLVVVNKYNEIPDNYKDKFNLLRSLTNVRDSRKIDEDFLKI